MVDMKTEIEQIEEKVEEKIEEKVEEKIEEKVEEKIEEKVEEIEVEEIEVDVKKIRERLKSGDMRISEIADISKKISKKIEEKIQKMHEIDGLISSYKDIVSRLEREKQRVREEIRELNIALSELTDGVKAIMGLTISKISGKPITNSNQGKGYRVYVKTTEQGVKRGLNYVNAEFSSMAKATYALGVVSEGKRTDFRAKLESLAKQGLIELQYL